MRFDSLSCKKNVGFDTNNDINNLNPMTQECNTQIRRFYVFVIHVKMSLANDKDLTRTKRNINSEHVM